MRVAQQESSIEDFEDYGPEVRPYGVQGDNQAGIDFFARLPSASNAPTHYRTYQCKNEKDFGPAKIKAAVRLFRKGKWRSRSQEFVLCTRESLQGQQRSDEVELQKRVMKKADITFTTWDSVTLNTKLKDAPRLVDEFFGREWVRLFCGEEAVSELARKRPLRPEQVRELRGSLHDFYDRLFYLHDPSLPTGSLQMSRALPLEERFTVPNIETETPVLSNLEVQKTDARDATQWHQDVLSRNRHFEEAEPFLNSETKTRFPLESWLLASSRSVILGDAGSGKSTLSRFLTLDLLAPEPRFPQLRTAWEGAFAVWLPFGLWTRRVTDSPTQPEISLASMLRDWFLSQDESRLWELVEEALEDERLVLIVDGLDEWSEETAARVALRHLQLFCERRHIPTIITGRPYGFSRLSMPSEGWQIGHLSAFETTQQEQLVRTWLTHFLTSHTPKEAASTNVSASAENGTVVKLTEEFMAQIADSPDLRELAGNPLLLCLLLGLSLHRKHLPSNRFEAYSEAVRYLIEDHPRRRADAMGVAQFRTGGADLSETDWRAVFAFLGFQMQTRQSQGTVETGEARRWIEEFLRDENRLGLDAKTAREIARALIDISDDATGLLVRKSPHDVGFYHRSFQEYLAAEHLQSLPQTEQLRFIEEHADDPQWHEVILAFCSRQNQASGFREIVQTLERVESQSLLQSYRLAPLLAEIAFGPFPCPANLARGIAQRVFERIERDAHTPIRTILLGHALNGLRSPRMRALVTEKMNGYFPARRGIWSGFYRVMGEWSRSPEVEAVLFDALFNEIEDNRLAAAFALSKIGDGDFALGERIANVAQDDWRAPVRAAALACLRLGWPQNTRLAALAKAGIASADYRLRYESVVARIVLNQHTDSDRRVLWDIVTSRDARFWLDADGSEIGAVLLRGWPDSTQLKRECLILARRLRKGKSLRKGEDTSIFDAGDAVARVVVQVLVTGFVEDDEVAQCLAEQLEASWERRQNKEYATKTLFDDFHGDQMKLLRKQAPRHPKVLNAVEKWLSYDWEHKPMGWQDAVLLCPTEERKQKILRSAQHFSSPTWPNSAAELALEGWGLEDDATKMVLNSLAWGEASKASAVGEILPRLIPNVAECRARILEILHAPNCENFAAVLEGLVQLHVELDDAEIVDALFSKTGPFVRYGTRYFSDSYEDPRAEHEKWPNETEFTRVLKPHTDAVDLRAINWDAFCDNHRSQGILAYIFALFPADPRVRELALLILQRPEGDFAAIGRAFQHDENLRQQLLSIASPLPVVLRRTIAARVRQGSGDTTFDWKMARLATFDHDDQVRVLGSFAFHRLLRQGWEEPTSVPEDCALPAREEVIEKLREGMEIWGTASHRRHMMDFVGLLALDHLDIVRETQPDGLNFQFLRQNPALVEIMVENWGKIESELGENPFKTSPHDSTESDFWEMATPLSAPYPAARAAAIRYYSAENKPNRLSLHDDVLLLLLAQLGDSEGFLAAFSRLHFVTDVATTVLARFFGGNTAILERLSGSRWQEIKARWRELKNSGVLPSGEVALAESVAQHPEVNELDWEVRQATHEISIKVLCEGWPRSEEAKILFEVAKRQHWQVKGDDWFRIGEHISDSQSVAEQFQSYLQTAPNLKTYERESRSILRSVGRRLNRDTELRDQFFQILNGSPTAQEKINIARLLLQSSSSYQDAAMWIGTEIERQQAKRGQSAQVVEEGFDLTANCTKSVALALLELMASA